MEGLHEDIDFRAKVTREEMDNLCSEFYNRAPTPLNDALKMAGVSLVSYYLKFFFKTIIRYRLVCRTAEISA